MVNIKQILFENGLTPREIYVCILISQEKTTKELAYDLGITYNTATMHIKNATRKLGLKSKHQLVSTMLYLKETGKLLDWVKIEATIDKNIEISRKLIESNVRQNSQN